MYKVIEKGYDWTGSTWVYTGFESIAEVYNFVEDISKLSREGTTFKIVKEE